MQSAQHFAQRNEVPCKVRSMRLFSACTMLSACVMLSACAILSACAMIIACSKLTQSSVQSAQQFAQRNEVTCKARSVHYDSVSVIVKDERTFSEKIIFITFLPICFLFFSRTTKIIYQLHENNQK